VRPNGPTTTSKACHVDASPVRVRGSLSRTDEAKAWPWSFNS
jgi:hypothetical protein